MKIVIETIPHSRQRYPTAGDWIFEDGELHVFVSDLGDVHMEALVGLHEVIEALLCDKNGIAEESVRAFDEANPDSDDPGGLPYAPYHLEHVFAEGIERQVARVLDVDWTIYAGRVAKLFG